MRVMITVLILLSSIYSSNASSIFDIQNEIYIDNVSQLPVSSNLIPDKAWSPSQEYFAENCRRAKNPYFLTGWIDIIGFKNLSQKNGTFYLRGDPSNEAIVQYEVNVCALGYPRFKGGFENKLDTYQQGKHFVARLTSTAILYYYIEGHKYYDNITRVFYDYEELPLKIESNNKDIEVTIIENNYTIINSTEISIDIDNSVFDQYLVKAEYGYFEKINRVWRVDRTSKGVYYANESELDIFKSDNLSHIQNAIIIPDLNFNITANGFYYSTNQTNVTRIAHNSDPRAQFMNLDLIGFLMMFSAFCVFIVHMKRQFI